MNASSENKQQETSIMQHEPCSPPIGGLHANEGERAEMVGNRRALYEQFTVSSHRFFKVSGLCNPSSTMFSCQEHSILKAGEHPPSPSLPSTSLLPPSSRAQSFTCLFFGTTEGTVVCDSTSHDASRRQPKALSTMGESLDDTSSKRSEELLASRLPSQHFNEDKTAFTSPASGINAPGADVMMLVKGAQCLSIEDGSQCSSACNEEGLPPQSEGYTCIGSDCKGIVLTDKVPLKAPEQIQTASHGEQDKDTSVHCLQQAEAPEVGHTLHEGVPLDGPAVEMQGKHCSSERCIVTKEGYFDETPHCATAHDCLQESDSTGCKMNLRLALPGHDRILTKRAEDNISSILARGSTECTATGVNCSPSRDPAGVETHKCKLAETAQTGIQIGNGMNDTEVGCPSVSPKAVIQAVGQLRFWKARLALIRQQRIFSDQVFELHKLIEVQRLIAENADVPINEMYFGVGSTITDRHNNGPLCGSSDKEEDTPEASEMEISASNQVARAPVIGGEASSKSQICHSKSPTNRDAMDNEVNAWKPLSLGVAPWATTAPAQTGFCPCPYPPFPGGFAPGPVIGSPFATAVQEHGAAIMGCPPFPYSFPVALQRPKLAHTMQSSYGSAVAFAHEQQSVPYNSSFSGYRVSNQSGPKMMDKKRCAHEAPSVSKMTINSEPDIPLHQMGAGCSPPINFHLQRYEKEAQSGRRALKMFGSDTKKVQRTSRGSGVNMPTAKPLDEKHNQHPKYNEKHAMQAVERSDICSKEVRGWKKHKESNQQDQPADVSRGHEMLSLNPYMNALNLFPLGPTSCLDDCEMGLSRGGKEWQGHVIKVVPRAAKSAPESTAGILLSIQKDRKP